MGSSQDDRFRRLVREHSPEVANYLRRRLYPLTPADLDDLVEETMLVVWRRLDDVPADAERPWIIGVARNMGGWRNWSQNLLNGPPIPAPPSFTGLALAGLAALGLLEDHPDD